ncbi:hypothetical protein LCGC14_2766550 [marine sediment metagenome]|uniref:Uncharacterized protein n=1 Tax=marine sediment metagenome TaxID=412755 RepID=A0A0F8ZJ79_9ZZZZ
MKRGSIKRFLKYALPLVLVLVMAGSVWSAELTLSEINRGTLGPLRVMTGFATTASVDTLEFPFKNVLYVGMMPRIAPATDDRPVVWYTISGTTITVYVNTADDTPADDSFRVDFFIVGY